MSQSKKKHERKNMTNLKKNATNLTLTLLLGLSLTLTGCLNKATKIQLAIPTAPTIQSQPMPDGGVCFDKANAIKLGEYIQELERTIKHK
jgi:hypothetical protein